MLNHPGKVYLATVFKTSLMADELLDKKGELHLSA